MVISHLVKIENVLMAICLGGILIFCEIGAHAKFQNPRTTPSTRKVKKGPSFYLQRPAQAPVVKMYKAAYKA